MVTSCAGCGPAGRFIRREVQVDVLDRFDSATGFAAMERTTGFHMAIVAQSLGQGNLPGRRNSPGTGRHSGRKWSASWRSADIASEDVLDLIGHFTQLAYSSPVGTSSAERIKAT